MEFRIHVLISGMIFGFIAVGYRLYIQIRNTIDFSYMAIVFVSGYIAALGHHRYGLGYLTATMVSFVCCIPIAMITVSLSSRLRGTYFGIGTFSLYMICFVLASQMRSVTGGALGIGGITMSLGSWSFDGMSDYLIWYTVISVICVGLLSIFTRSIIWKYLQGRGENQYVAMLLGAQQTIYVTILLLITTFFASVGSSMYVFYYHYINPYSFWTTMLNTLLIIVFLSVGKHTSMTYVVAITAMLIYEGLRFFKAIDPGLVGYIRELLFAVVIMITVAIIYLKKDKVRLV